MIDIATGATSSTPIMVTVGVTTELTPFTASRTIALPPYLVDQPPSKNTVSFNGSNFTVSVNINLAGDKPSQDVVDIWESGIENIWSNQFNLVDSSGSYPILVDAVFLPADVLTVPDFTVRVRDEFCRSDSLDWCTQPMTDMSGIPNLAMRGQVAAHEFGHLLGLYDEYVGGAVSPAADPGDLCRYVFGFFPTGSFCGSMMADFGPIQARYFKGIESFVEGATSRNFVLGMNPLLNSYYFVDPGPAFVGIQEGHVTPVPEPETYTMLLAGLGLLGFTARRRKGVSRQAA